jgi:uncharacterized protein (TIGR03435 family)
MRALISLGVVIAIVASLHAQAPRTRETGATIFDSASIKYSEAKNLDMSIGADLKRGRFSAINASLVDLLLWAYGIELKQIVGGPDWIKSMRFNVEGQAPKTTRQYSRDDILLMVQPLLEQRFNLAFRREGYAFVIDHVEQPTPD